MVGDDFLLVLIGVEQEIFGLDPGQDHGAQRLTQVCIQQCSVPYLTRGSRRSAPNGQLLL